MADRPGVVFLRTTRGKTPIIYGPDESFPIGGSRVVHSSGSDDVTLVGAGITLHEAISAAESLAAAGIRARVIDLYSIKPIDAATLVIAARDTGHIVTVEDHRPEGGLGEAVLAALSDADVHPRVSRLAVASMPGSATPEEQLADHRIDANAIVDAVLRLLGR
jgi:transketolase